MSDNSDFVCIDEPASAQDVALIHVALTGSDIIYHIENEHYSQLTDGVVGIADARMRLMVEGTRADEVRRILNLDRGQ